MILDVKNLKVEYKEKKKKVTIVEDISFQLSENRCLGIVGESGSGKSMTWKALTGILDDNFEISGEVKFKGKSLLNMNKKEKRDVRGKDITVIVQNPMTAFDPLFKIKSQMIETFRSHKKMSKKEAYALSLDILERLNLPSPKDSLNKYPHELSGGMLQRIMIGIAIALNPSMIIADEPTTAIDTINQVEVIRELKELRDKFKVAMIFISHDLSVVHEIADDILVMANGKVAEYGSADEIMNNPQSEHTKYLVNTRKKLLDRFVEHTDGGGDIAFTS